MNDRDETAVLAAAREAIREAIHKAICDEQSIHDAAFGRCHIAADAIDLAALPALPAHTPARSYPLWGAYAGRANNGMRYEIVSDAEDRPAHPPAPLPLDPKVLAQALVNSRKVHEDFLSTPTAEAIWLAAEYARLVNQEPTEDGGVG